MVQDIGVAVRRYLLDDAEVSYLTEGRVYVEDLPAADNSSMPRKCVVLRGAGGLERGGWERNATPRFDMWSYGETRYEAGRVDRAIWDALQQMERNVSEETLLHFARLSGGGRSEKEPETGWPVVIRSITIQAATEGV